MKSAPLFGDNSESQKSLVNSNGNKQTERGVRTDGKTQFLGRQEKLQAQINEIRDKMNLKIGGGGNKDKTSADHKETREGKLADTRNEAVPEWAGWHQYQGNKYHAIPKSTYWQGCMG